MSPLHASIAILGCHPLYVRRLWLGKTRAKVGYGLRYVNTYYGLFGLHFGLIRWDLREPNFIYLAHHHVSTKTLSGLADPPTSNLADPHKMLSLPCKRGERDDISQANANLQD